MSHDHDQHHHDQDRHDHDEHGHHHAPSTFGLTFAIGVVLNGGFVIGEVIYGLLINSVALLADAGHNLFDVLGLLAAWAAAHLATRAPSARYTFGLKGSTILAALFNSVLLLVAVGAIGWEAIQRLYQPVQVPGLWVMAVAAIGIATNGITALLFMRERQDDINMRGAYLHMLGDALVSAGVVAAGFLMLKTGWLWLDPLTSLAIVAVIIYSSWSLLSESLAMTLNAAPASVNPAAVRALLAAQKGVASVHDLHIWAMSTTDTALTAHLFMPQGHPGDEFITHVTDELKHYHRIAHATLQIETNPATQCNLHCDVAA